MSNVQICKVACCREGHEFVALMDGITVCGINKLPDCIPIPAVCNDPENVFNLPDCEAPICENATGDPETVGRTCCAVYCESPATYEFDGVTYTVTQSCYCDEQGYGTMDNPWDGLDPTQDMNQIYD